MATSFVCHYIVCLHRPTWLQKCCFAEVNLLITEEGWGLSSANWLIKRSAWSMNFLHDALTAAHVELQLFGDQDAMILHLMNRYLWHLLGNVFQLFPLSTTCFHFFLHDYFLKDPFCNAGTFCVCTYGPLGRSLEAVQEVNLENVKDPLDSHAAIIPQFELNAYDALNALTMECDTFVEGDFLVTFPQCKDAEGCRLSSNTQYAYRAVLPHSKT